MRSLLLFLALLLAACGTPPLPTSTASQPIARMVTIAGLDPVTNQDISPVRVWDDYLARSKVVGSVKTGDSVGLIEQKEQSALIELPNGTRGWVSTIFIQELR
jgi:uncharacterized lipoprotein YmbA